MCAQKQTNIKKSPKPSLYLCINWLCVAQMWKREVFSPGRRGGTKFTGSLREHLWGKGALSLWQTRVRGNEWWLERAEKNLRWSVSAKYWGMYGGEGNVQLFKNSVRMHKWNMEVERWANLSYSCEMHYLLVTLCVRNPLGHSINSNNLTCHSLKALDEMNCNTRNLNRNPKQSFWFQN